MSGNNVSHANNKTRRRFLPNLQSKKIWLAEEKRWLKVKVAASVLRTIDKIGLSATLKKYSV
jgi:large subunit ribosomal protein L28